MAGIYFHIPFCKQACHYCNFHFSTSTKTYSLVFNGMLKELTQRKTELERETVETIYFGGGTPSILNDDDLKKILIECRKSFNVIRSPEITLETNPDDIFPKRLERWKQIGVNRLSIGIQSFFDDDLKWMNRAHSGKEAEQCIIWAKEAGFENITADLIYGLPHNHWKENIQKMINLQIPHISSYALMVEEKTALHHFIKSGKAKLPEDEKTEEDYRVLCNELQKANFEHYEISNFAKAGYRSKHNGAYWKGIKYLGIGPAAHSFNGTNRRWNIANNAKYGQYLSEGSIYWEEEVLSEKDRLNEYVMTSLRTVEGIDTNHLQSHFSKLLKGEFEIQLEKLLHKGFLIYKETHITIPEKEWFRADTIITELFLID